VHKPRTAHRWRLLFTILAGTFLAFGTFWLVQVMQRGDNDIAAGAARNDPDYIVEKFSFVRMTADGKPRYLFYGAKLTHRPLDDVSDVERPMMQNMTPGAAPMAIVAEKARIRHAESQVDLLGKVDIHRPASPMGKDLRLKTEALTIFPDEDRMVSKQQVQMTLGAISVTGVGMRANNATRQIDFDSQGRLVIPPKAAR
jgi:lipopolysaccharide export system protein LptC